MSSIFRDGHAQVRGAGIRDGKSEARIAAQEHRPKSLLLTGGVAANSLLRAEGARMADALGLPFYVPPLSLSTDNAAMIGAAGFINLRKGMRAGWDLDPVPHLALGA